MSSEHSPSTSSSSSSSEFLGFYEMIRSNRRWINDDSYYFSRRPGPWYAHSTEPTGIFPLLLSGFCGLSCYIGWVYGNVLFCEHNRSFCRVCGETWVRFAIPASHRFTNRESPCTIDPSPEVKSILETYK